MIGDPLCRGNTNGIEHGIDAGVPLDIGWIARSGSDFGIVHC
jgi:hypothetical protein